MHHHCLTFLREFWGSKAHALLLICQVLYPLVNLPNPEHIQTLLLYSVNKHSPNTYIMWGVAGDLEETQRIREDLHMLHKCIAARYAMEISMEVLEIPKSVPHVALGRTTVSTTSWVCPQCRLLNLEPKSGMWKLSPIYKNSSSSLGKILVPISWDCCKD